MSSQTEAFLSGYPENIASLAREVCDLVSENAPGATERVQAGWKAVTYEHARGFCAVAPHRSWVNLQFYSGAELSDPASLLEGTGKSMRHVKIRESGDLGKEVASLVRAAAALARPQDELSDGHND